MPAQERSHYHDSRLSRELNSVHKALKLTHFSRWRTPVPRPPQTCYDAICSFPCVASLLFVLKAYTAISIVQIIGNILLFFVHTHLRESIPPIKCYQFGPTDGNCERRHAKSQSKYLLRHAIFAFQERDRNGIRKTKETQHRWVRNAPGTFAYHGMPSVTPSLSKNENCVQISPKAESVSKRRPKSKWQNKNCTHFYLAIRVSPIASRSRAGGGI